MSESAASKKVTLMSSDGETFEVEEAVALLSQTIRHMIEDDCANNTIPLPNVTGATLSKVIEYCTKHAAATPSAADEDLTAWDADFVKVDQTTLFDLILVTKPSRLLSFEPSIDHVLIFRVLSFCVKLSLLRWPLIVLCFICLQRICLW